MLPRWHSHRVRGAPFPRTGGARHGGFAGQCADTPGSGYSVARPCTPTVSCGPTFLRPWNAPRAGLQVFLPAQGVPSDPCEHAHSLFKAPDLLALLCREQFSAFAHYVAQENLLIAQAVDELFDTSVPLLLFLPGHVVETSFFNRLNNGFIRSDHSFQQPAQKLSYPPPREARQMQSPPQIRLRPPGRPAHRCDHRRGDTNLEFPRGKEVAQGGNSQKRDQKQRRTGVDQLGGLVVQQKIGHRLWRQAIPFLDGAECRAVQGREVDPYRVFWLPCSRRPHVRRSDSRW